MAETTGKKRKTLKAVILAIIIALSFGSGYFVYHVTMPKDVKTLRWVVEMINKHALVYDENTGEVRKFTADDFANSMVDLIDIYSEYYTREDYQETVYSNQGNKYGIGISFSGNKIVKVLGNSPAEKSGLKVGQKIVKVAYNGTDTVVSDSNDFINILNTIPKETNFDVYVEGEQNPYTVSKRLFVESSVWYYDNQTSMTFNSDFGVDPVATIGENTVITGLDESTAYVKLDSFMSKSETQFAKAMEYMKERSKTKLILDLRSNGGGQMDKLQVIASYLITNDKNSDKITVASARYKDGSEYFFKTERNNFAGLEDVVVLANEGTASASECLMGAMISYGILKTENVVITGHNIGETEKFTTYGKGIMQTTYTNFETGEAIKLTTAYIYWPDGTTNIHGKGISTSDVKNQISASESLNRPIERAIEILS